ncbi:MAG: DUF6165 family protein [Cyanobacteriota bacterium]
MPELQATVLMRRWLSKLEKMDGDEVAQSKENNENLSDLPPSPSMHPDKSKAGADHLVLASMEEALQHIKQGQLQSAERIYRTLIDDGIIEQSLFSNLAAVCGMQGRWEEMIPLLRNALAMDPSFADAHNNLGIALRRSGDPDAAIQSFRKALELNPQFPDAHNNLGLIFQEKGDIQTAITFYHKTLELSPGNSEALNNLGLALHGLGDLDGAIRAFHAALELKANFPEAQKNLSMAELHSGDYTKGWMRYDFRFLTPNDSNLLDAVPRIPRWDGRPLTPQDQLLLVGEQGLGDTLQFMRYAATLRAQGIRVSLCAQPKLHSLIRQSGLDRAPLTPEQATNLTTGEWIPLLSVPRHLAVSPGNPVSTEPYIRTTEALRQHWKHLLANEQRPLIAIHWQGNPAHETMNSIGRSLPLETFATIASKTNATFVSLQKGPGSEQLEQCSFRERFVRCQPLIDDTWDFLETAAIIANCDLVITSDSATAHLAGGMGHATWLLLKQVPEWRWGLDGETTFWYHSMRLFRQKERGQWQEVMERVAEELQHRPETISHRTSASERQLSVPERQESPDATPPFLRDLTQIQIFCLSLPTAGARRQSILEMTTTRALKLELVDAVDGRSCSREEIQKQTDRIIAWDSLNGHRDAIQLPTEAACAISHLQIWQRILDQGLPEAIILEDDVFLGSISTIAVPDDADFIFLGSRVSSNERREAAAPLCGAEAYYVTRDCCEKLLQIYTRILMPVDIQWLPQMKSLIASNHFLTEFTNPSLPTIQAYAEPGIFRLNEHSGTSQIRPSQPATPAGQTILAPISLGELIDKITILQIKCQHLKGLALVHVRHELQALQATLTTLNLTIEDRLVDALMAVNQQLWDIEDAIRHEEKKNNFGETFIQLARSVYQINDRRAAIKKEINIAHGSALVEEKSYQDY